MTIEEQYRPAEAVDVENRLDLRKPTRKEIQSTSGVTESTNRVEIRVDNNTMKLVLEKHVGRKDGLKVAQTELDILLYLEGMNTETVFSRAASDQIHEDEDGIPTIYIEMNPDYLPFAGDNTFFQQILDDSYPRKLNKAVAAIREMHNLGVHNGDLHLNNIGELPPELHGQEARIMIIDFDLGKRDEYLYPDEIEDDLARFATHVLMNFNSSEIPAVQDKIFSAIKSSYGTSIYMPRLEERIGKTTSQDDSYLK